MLNAIMSEVITNLRTVASGQATAATARESIRESIPTLFPPAPTKSEIDAVKKSDAWVEFDAQARRVFAVAWCTAPRMVDETTYYPAESDIRFWEADKKAAKTFTPAEAEVRKAIQAYVRVSVKQNITDFIPDATDAVDAPETVKLPDPVAILALVDDALCTLSEHDKAAALALLNGLDALVTAVRKPLSEGKVLTRKA